MKKIKASRVQKKKNKMKKRLLYILFALAVVKKYFFFPYKNIKNFCFEKIYFLDKCIFLYLLDKCIFTGVYKKSTELRHSMVAYKVCFNPEIE